VIGVGFALAVGNSVLIETVFSRTGLGTALMTAVFNRDYVVVQSIVFVLALIVVIMNLLLDLTYPLIDPRLRKGLVK
jgi:ABC-type dipeptide/oligopeptide/nickel transport system permease component